MLACRDLPSYLRPMVHPPTRDLVAFSDALECLYGINDIAEYPDAVFQTIPMVLPSAILSVDAHNIAQRTSSSHCNRPPPAGFSGWADRILELIPTHPAFEPIHENPGQVLAISDCVSQRQFVQTPLYCDVLRPMDCSHQLVLGLEIPGHVAGVTISRDVDFTGAERALVELMRPHLSRAFNQARLLTQFRNQDGSVPSPETLTQLGTTPRESEVLHWIMLGKRDGEIAQIVGCKLRTVQKHVTRILAKLSVETRTAAAQEAGRRCRLRLHA